MENLTKYHNLLKFLATLQATYLWKDISIQLTAC